ncbi:CsgG/HfaB family protein [Elusimicrobiota bacterium]
MKKALILIFIFTLSASNIFAAKKETIAVMDFEGQNVSAMDATVVTGFLRTALVNDKYFNVTERKSMEKVLAEQGFQQTGCTTQDCAVKIGNLLNVQKIIIGNLSKLGNTYYVTANIVDVETGEIVISDRVKSQTQAELDYAMESLAKRIVAKAKGKKIEPQMQGSITPAAPPPARQKPVVRRVVTSGGSMLGLGLNYPGASFRYLSSTPGRGRNLHWELKYQQADSIPAIGCRLSLYLNKAGAALFFMGAEVAYTSFTYELCKVTGFIAEPYLGLELFVSETISFQVDMGPAFYRLSDSNYDVKASGYEICANIGMTFYIARL